MVEPSARVGGLSVGERQRVEIFKALYRYVKILILDEPTAHLPPQEADDLFATLRLATANGLSIPFIFHKLHEVIEISDRVRRCAIASWSPRPVALTRVRTIAGADDGHGGKAPRYHIAFTM